MIYLHLALTHASYMTFKGGDEKTSDLSFLPPPLFENNQNQSPSPNRSHPVINRFHSKKIPPNPSIPSFPNPLLTPHSKGDSSNKAIHPHLITSPHLTIHNSILRPKYHSSISISIQTQKPLANQPVISSPDFSSSPLVAC